MNDASWNKSSINHFSRPLTGNILFCKLKDFIEMSKTNLGVVLLGVFLYRGGCCCCCCCLSGANFGRLETIVTGALVEGNLKFWRSELINELETNSVSKVFGLC